MPQNVTMLPNLPHRAGKQQLKDKTVRKTIVPYLLWKVKSKGVENCRIESESIPGQGPEVQDRLDTDAVRSEHTVSPA